MSPAIPALLRDRPQFRSLWAALALSYAGSGAAITALTLYVQQTHGTGAAVAELLIAESVPRLLGPLAGGIADRFDLRRVLIAADVGQAALFALIALLPPFGVLLGLTAATSLLQTTYGGARSAAIPALVAEEELLTANALLGIAPNLFVAVGPFAGGLLFAAGGVSLAMAVNVATFLVSAWLTRRISQLPPETGDGGRESLLSGARVALRFAMADRITRTVLLTIFATFAFLAVDNVALVFLVRDTLGGSAAAYGIAAAVFGIGMLGASLTIARGTAVSAPRLYLLSLLFSATGTLLTGLAPAVAAVAAVQIVSGTGNGIEIVASETILHRRIPRRLLGRVAGLLSTATAGGMAVAMGIGGYLVDATSPRTAFVGAGIGCFAVAALATPALLRARDDDDMATLQTHG